MSITSINGLYEHCRKNHCGRYSEEVLEDHEQLLRVNTSHILRCLLEGLHFLHQQGLVHGNLSGWYELSNPYHLNDMGIFIYILVLFLYSYYNVKVCACTYCMYVCILYMCISHACMECPWCVLLCTYTTVRASL